MERLIIGAPFGNWLRWPGTTSTLGTYTWRHRAGPLGRVWKIITTVRYYARIRAYLNRLGLPNPGLPHLAAQVQQGRGPVLHDAILSVRGDDALEWRGLLRMGHALHPLAMELNYSCPNVAGKAAPCLITESAPAVEEALAAGMTLIAKLPPVRWLDLAAPLYGIGVRRFHLCNTMPTPGGGLSGKPLKQYSLWAVEDLRQRWGNEVDLTGGGGVDSIADLEDYIWAGVDRVAVASMLLNPATAFRLTAFARHLHERLG